jgi:hypothetical protein
MNRPNITSKFAKFPLLLIALVAGMFVLAGCGGSDKDAPKQAVQDALKKTSTITSGKAELKGSMAQGTLPGSIAIEGGGPFDTKAEGGPAYEVMLNLGIAGQQMNVGVVATDGKNYLVVDGKALEQKGEDAGIGLDANGIADFIEGLGQYVTSAEDGAEENTYNATVDLEKMFAEGASGDNAALKKLSIPGLGSAAENFKTADVVVHVDSQGYADSVDINLPMGEKKSGDSGDSQGALRITLKLTEINQPQTIEKPKNIVKDASELGGIGQYLGAQ